MELAMLFGGGMGLIIGSFLNVLIFRRGSGRGVGGRSACMSCGMALHWHDLIPVFSYLAYRGRCRGCGSRISIQYPLVEMATAVAFASCMASGLPVAMLLPACVTAALLIAIGVYDSKHTVIPDEWAYLAIVAAFWYGALALSPSLSIVGAACAAAPILALWIFSSGRAMGFGDVYLALAIGALLGPFLGLKAIAVAFMVGGAFSALLLLASSAPFARLATHRQSLRKLRAGYTMKSEVAFGPFLVIGCFIVWFTHLYGISLPLMPA